MRIGILTSGGDCPVSMRLSTAFAKRLSIIMEREVTGIHSGFQGLLTKDVESFTDSLCPGY